MRQRRLAGASRHPPRTVGPTAPALHHPRHPSCPTARPRPTAPVHGPTIFLSTWSIWLGWWYFTNVQPHLGKPRIWKFSILYKLILVIIQPFEPIKIFEIIQKSLIFSSFSRFWTIFAYFFLTKWCFSEILSILPILFAWGCVRIDLSHCNIQIANP